MIIINIKQIKQIGLKKILNNQQGKTGFTMMELLVSISIIVLISGIFLANFHYAEQQGKVNMAAQKLASDIRLMQSYALALKEFETISDFPEGGWGIFLTTIKPDDDSYYVYADHEDGSGGNPDHEYDNGELFNQIALPAGVSIEGIRIDGTPRNTLHITFVPPDPTTWICRNASQCITESDGESVEITLENSSGSYTKKIYANIFGLVDVEN